MKEKDIRLYEYYLKPGYIFLNTEPSIISTVVASCVAVSLWDCRKKYGGMAHYLYPFTDSGDKTTARYGNVSISYLIRMFLKEGTNKKNIKAQIFGGASLQQSTESREVAKENVRIARSVLKGFKIRIISEDVGGAIGRKLVYNTSTNEVIVYKAKKLRRSDWYPYISDRE
ncbi:MAG: chemotaxis protein CheD [Thermodesulfobacteriota bacterium]|nr:chemotaxis protein CheD [Thermodesulfobacteriota bacterium]